MHISYISILLGLTATVQLFSLNLETKKELVDDLFAIGAIKTGQFTFKSGIVSPIYIDMRTTISHPKVFATIVTLLAEQLKQLKYDHIVGVPYAALPLATGVALTLEKPMIMPRKEIKDHGTRRSIEGVYKAGECAVIIEDVVTTGSSVLEIVDILKKEGIEVHDVIASINWEKGAREKLAAHGITLHELCTITDLFVLLRDAGHTV